MIISLTLSWIIAVVYCSLRLSSALLLTPVLQAVGLPLRIRVLLVLMISISLVMGMSLAPVTLPTDLLSLFASSINEVVAGGMMAFGIFAAFAAFSFAGNLLDVQIGFNIANVYDPVSRSQSPLLASLLLFLALALFFSLDAHHALIQGLAYSFKRIPLGAALDLPNPMVIVRQFGSIFTFGLLLAAPPLFALFFVQLGMAVLSRSIPQLNVFLVSMPINIFVGLTVLVLALGQYGAVANKIFEAMFNFWESAL